MRVESVLDFQILLERFRTCSLVCLWSQAYCVLDSLSIAKVEAMTYDTNSFLPPGHIQG